MNIQCPNCHALHFMAERLSNSSNARPHFGMCCLQGQVSLPPIRRWPPGLQAHFEDPRFREKIRQYNAALAFTSLGVNAEPQTVQGSGPMSFHVHGALHHLIGALLPEAEGEPSYAQLYIYDPQEATERRTRRNPQLDPAIMLSLHTILMENHPYAPLYKQAHDIMREKPPGEHTDMRVCLTLQQGTD
ncbi:hypothetical protein PISMIDRAFT_37058, partial [Pisolithus microcarpus 441]